MDDEAAMQEFEEALDNIKSIAYRHMLKGPSEDAPVEDAPPAGDELDVEDDGELLEDPRELRDGAGDEDAREFIGGRGAPSTPPPSLEEEPQLDRGRRPPMRTPVGRR